ncbi:MAG TPA: DNA gyrase inhibitor YacG [Pyrinomonadaceae bacterium]|jgi:endogenous inhibitor of DNA gyrase (YacG/DUF329 family)|nr:DNA gyrase inhibitor YacG [Pyrinomonadaceae bacterium]
MKCPTCGKQFEWENNSFRPFCSGRCKLIDLGAWVNEQYSVPGESTLVPDEPDTEKPNPTETDTIH